MKRWIATVLCLLLLIGCLPAVSAATVVDVSDKAGFAAIGSDLAGSYRLTKDIIFTAEDFAEGGVMHGKLPFAAGSTFSGTLDGNGYTVAGLMIDVAYRLDDTVAPRQESGVNSAALFYDLSGSVKNLELKNVALNFTADVKSVFSELRVGAIAGTMQASAIIDQCAVSGAIVVRHNGNGRLNVGGLAGFCQGDVTNSACYVDISANRNYDAWLRVGGLVGQLDTAAAQLSKCYANTVITTVNSAGTDNCRQGALTGRNNGSVENCYFAGTEDAVTGDAGANATVTETDNLNTADLSLTDSYKWLDFTNLWSIQTVNGVRQAGLQAFVCEHTTPGPWTEVSAPSCFAVGKEVQRCALCGDVMNQRDIPATGEHVWATTLTQGETTH